jgi:hypothetical protein
MAHHQDALFVKKPFTFIGNAEFDMLDWHDDLIETGVVPVVSYNPGNKTACPFCAVVVPVPSVRVFRQILFTWLKAEGLVSPRHKASVAKQSRG